MGDESSSDECSETAKMLSISKILSDKDNMTSKQPINDNIDNTDVTAKSNLGQGADEFQRVKGKVFDPIFEVLSAFHIFFLINFIKAYTFLQKESLNFNINLSRNEFVDEHLYDTYLEIQTKLNKVI